MLTIWNHECKSNFKNFLIWSLSVGGMGFLCILLYQTMEGSMKDIADSFSSMGTFSDAFGMNTLSIATLKGYFASQIGVIHRLGSSMFAASIGITILSKEEDLHTAEYLFSLPLSRAKILFTKTGALFLIIIMYHIVCGCLYLAGFLLLGQNLGISSFLLFLSSQILMSLEIASICFCISAFYKKNPSYCIFGHRILGLYKKRLGELSLFNSLICQLFGSFILSTFHYVSFATGKATSLFEIGSLSCLIT